MKEDPDTTLNIGIVGAGHWGKNYVRLLHSMPGVRLAAVADLDPAKRALVRQTCPDVPVYERHQDLLAQGGCDAVVIATVASTHHALITDALLAGHDVLAEKPFTLAVAEADDLIALAAQRQRILMVAHTFLFNPAVVQIKRYLQEGMAGDIYYLRAQRTHLGLIRHDVNAAWDLAPHDISMFLYWLGEKPSTVQAIGRRILKNPREDVVFINMGFPSGPIAQITVSWADSNKQRQLDIVGSRARIVFDDLSVQEPLRIFYKGISVETEHELSFGEFKYMVRDGDIVSPKIPVQEPLRCLCDAFVHSIRTREQPYSDGTFGRDVVDVLCRISAGMDS